MSDSFSKTLALGYYLREAFKYSKTDPRYTECKFFFIKYLNSCPVNSLALAYALGTPTMLATIPISNEVQDNPIVIEAKESSTYKYWLKHILMNRLGV